MKINSNLDSCGNSLGFKCCYQIVSRTFCNDCHLAKYGPKEIGYFMANWNLECRQKEKSKKFDFLISNIVSIQLAPLKLINIYIYCF